MAAPPKVSVWTLLYYLGSRAEQNSCAQAFHMPALLVAATHQPALLISHGIFSKHCYLLWNEIPHTPNNAGLWRAWTPAGRTRACAPLLCEFTHPRLKKTHDPKFRTPAGPMMAIKFDDSIVCEPMQCFNYEFHENTSIYAENEIRGWYTPPVLPSCNHHRFQLIANSFVSYWSGTRSFRGLVLPIIDLGKNIFSVSRMKNFSIEKLVKTVRY